MHRLFVFVVVMVVAIGAPLYAAPIPIFSTGGAAPTNPDPNWTITASPSGAGVAFVTDTAGFPFPPWLPNSASSGWISPQASYTSLQSDIPVSQYDYGTAFDLTGLNPSTAVISFLVAADDVLLDVLINGSSTGISGAGFTAFSGPFSITSGFQPGLNTLTFQTQNGPFGTVNNPNGLRVDIQTADAARIPEPGGLTLMLGGLLLLSLVLLRRRSNPT